MFSDSSLGELIAPLVSENIHPLGFFPLVYEGELLGQFMIYYDRFHEFPDEEIQVAQTLASHVALAIARKMSEESITGLNKRLQQAMTETHHRVKNNLQIIAA